MFSFYAGGEPGVYRAHIFTIIHTNVSTCCSAAWIPLGASSQQCREGSCLAVKILIYSALQAAWKSFLNCTTSPTNSPSSLDICGTLRALPISRYLTNEKEKEPCVETASAIMLVSESVLSFDEECAFSFTILEPGHSVCT